MAGFIDDDTLDGRQLCVALELLRSVDTMTQAARVSRDEWLASLGIIASLVFVPFPAEERHVRLELFLLRLREEVEKNVWAATLFEAGTSISEVAARIVAQSERDRRAH